MSGRGRWIGGINPVDAAVSQGADRFTCSLSGADKTRVGQGA